MLAIVCALVPSPSFALQSAPSESVQFRTEDGVTVHGDLYRAAGPTTGPVILLLHQSGSNSDEYLPIAPRLVAQGFHCLAIDARGGGDRNGRPNRTVAALPERGGGPQAHYDFKAALAFLRYAGYTGPLTVWGSSYSAGRMFHLLSERPTGVVAALAFSPGALFARRVNDEPSWAEQVAIPIFMTWSAEELDAERRARFDRVASADKVLHVQRHGVHGSSTLHPDRNPNGFEETWTAVLAFLDRFAR